MNLGLTLRNKLEPHRDVSGGLSAEGLVGQDLEVVEQEVVVHDGLGNDDLVEVGLPPIRNNTQLRVPPSLEENHPSKLFKE